eukprot:1996879-Alexandrium_andersonii.AAC.1
MNTIVTAVGPTPLPPPLPLASPPAAPPLPWNAGSAPPQLGRAALAAPGLPLTRGVGARGAFGAEPA